MTALFLAVTVSVAFIVCTEPGNLENQSSLLFRSIRKFGGAFRSAPIHSFQPRGGSSLADKTLKLFDELQVMHHTEVLNTEFAGFPQTNKVFACLWAEENLSEDLLVFLDSDTVFLNEPEELTLSEGYDAAVCPVETKMFASSGPDDEHEKFWQGLYSICGVDEPGFVRTRVDGKKVRAYWNSGLISARRGAGLFACWMKDMRAIIREGHFPPIHNNSAFRNKFLEQTVLAATLCRIQDRIKVLPHTYNYSLPKRPIMVEPQRSLSLEEIVHVHYHRWFNKKGFLSISRLHLDRKSARYSWLDRYLPFEPTIEDAFPF